MSEFIVSARKYRPATFRSVVGQGHITGTLQNAITRSQLAHAYLFCGPRGVGKTTCARIFAKAINCLSPRPDGEACGECESCRGFDEGRSFNIHELDAASNNSVDDIRSLTDQVRIPPQLGRYSVYIIDEVHMLSAAAFNAFLKTLEEPPAHAVFILATTEKHKIIPTILSRCQVFDFNRIKVSDGVEYMRYIADAEGVTYDEESLNLIARKADGGMRDALSMFDKSVSFCGPDLRYKEVAQSLNILDYDTYFSAVDFLLAGDWAGALTMFDGVLAQGFGGQVFMSGLAAHLRDLLVAGNAQTIDLLDVTGPLLERYTEQSARVSVDFLFSGIALLTDLDAKIRTATNQRLVVELGLMRLAGGCGCGRSELAGTSSSTDRGRVEQMPLPSVVAAPTPAPASAPAVEQKVGTPTAVASPEKKTPDVIVPSGDDLPPHPSVAATVPYHGGETEKTAPTTGIFGRPIGEIIAGGADGTGAGNGSSQAGGELQTEGGQTVDGQAAERRTDPEAGEKIEKARGNFLAELASRRPRLAVVYESMAWDGEAGVLRVKVPSEALREEVLRHWTETLALLVEMAGLVGAVEIEARIEAAEKPAKPIKIEDKLKHLADQNPEFNNLRKALELEIE